MSNHPSRAVTRRYAWHHQGFVEWMRAAGEQARIEQQLRRDARRDEREIRSCR